jgi:hypothetical protein
MMEQILAHLAAALAALEALDGTFEIDVCINNIAAIIEDVASIE